MSKTIKVLVIILAIISDDFAVVVGGEVVCEIEAEGTQIILEAVLPKEGGTTFTPIPVMRADIQKQIGKSFGDTVHVTFCERK